MSFNIHTDLAIENREAYQKAYNKQDDIPGVNFEKDGDKDVLITRVNITSEEGAKAIGKPIGNYITLEVPQLKEDYSDICDKAERLFADELRKLIKVNPKASVLVVGLGNWNVTPDALGPKVLSNLLVTRHLIEYSTENVDKNIRPVCGIAPGVLGITGIETSEIIKGVVEKVKPELVIAIDALASRKMERISNTIQIADTGINPGSGVGNKRSALSQETLGVPVIAIGVPTVVDAATMANDAIDIMISSMKDKADKNSEFYKMLENMSGDDKYSFIKEVLSPYVGNLIVTPKEIDDIITNVSDVVAEGINMALHGISNDEYTSRYLQ
jgi:spore protease